MNYNECGLLEESFPLKGWATSLTLPADIQNPSENYDCDNLDFSIESLISDLEQHLLKC
jgi:hypothetical protein